MSRTRHKLSTCPSCNAKLDTITSADPEREKAPIPGDISICFYCAMILTVEKNGGYHVTTVKELNSLDLYTLNILKDARKSVLKKVKND